MKKSQLNLYVIQNFILHLTHSGDHGLDALYKEEMTFTPETMYRVAKEYIEEDHIDGKDGDEPEVGEIQVHVQKISDTRDESFWYHDKTLASCLLPDGNTVQITAYGEIGITIQDDNDGEFYKNKDAVKKALRLNFQDEDLNNEDKIYWNNNNWFGLVVTDPEGNVVVDDDGDVDYSYADAINTIIAYVEENK